MPSIRWSAAQQGRLDRLRAVLEQARPRFSQVLVHLRRWPRGPDRDLATDWVEACERIPLFERKADGDLRQRLISGTAPPWARLVRVLDLRARRRHRGRQLAFASRQRLERALGAVGRLWSIAVDGFGHCAFDEGLDRVTVLQNELRFVAIRRVELSVRHVAGLLQRLPKLVRLDLRDCRLDVIELARLRALTRLRALRVTASRTALEVLHASPWLRPGVLRLDVPLGETADAVAELRTLPLPLHALWAGGPAARAVLRDRALENGLLELARALNEEWGPRGL